jgi:transcriptional regulator with XRE-family HTH domain
VFEPHEDWVVTRHEKGEQLLAGLGVSIAKRRTELNLSQEELADRAHVHRTYISDVERGVRNVSILTLERIAVALDIPLGVLFAWIPPMSQQGLPEPRRKRVP